MKLKRRPEPHKRWGYADFFDTRHKLKILKLAKFKASDILYDLGCGDAGFLIFVVKELGINAVGFENMSQRRAIANRNVKNAKLENKIKIKQDFSEADLAKADVIFDMMPEGEDDLKDLYSQKIRKGTRLIKHDLPLIGYLPDKIDIPFYRITFPLTLAASRTNWASVVLGRRKAHPIDLWNELYYYQMEKDYSLWEIKSFDKMLRTRISS